MRRRRNVYAPVSEVQKPGDVFFLETRLPSVLVHQGNSTVVGLPDVTICDSPAVAVLFAVFSRLVGLQKALLGLLTHNSKQSTSRMVRCNLTVDLLFLSRCCRK